MDSFLLWIGAYNVFGGVVVLTFLRESIADRVLRGWLQILAVPYAHGAHGPMWIWWASTTNLFFGATMMMASRWEAEAKRSVTIGAVLVYAVMFVVTLLAARSPRYRASGIYAMLVLWVAQMAWGAWSAIV